MMRKNYLHWPLQTVIAIGMSASFLACDSPVQNVAAATPPPALPVTAVHIDSATTSKDYPATLEGRINVEIRAQVDGYLDKIYVDEGTYVKKGQPLFKINDLPYKEQLNTALANLHVAEANQNTAQIETEKLTPLVNNHVISEVQLKTAMSSYNSAKASVELGKAAVAAAKINLGFTSIVAPVNGFISRIPKRIGNLVTKTDVEGMTTLSDIEQVYAYFSISESDFLYFNAHNRGNSIEEKIKQLRPVSLILADGTVYAEKGKVDLVNGQFERSTGAITLRATFPNHSRLLRSGNTGKIRMEEHLPSILLVPIAATVDQQDKMFVYLVGDSNKVKKQAITISGKTGTSYIVVSGVKVGDKIVVAGTETLADGVAITPQESSQGPVQK